MEIELNGFTTVSKMQDIRNRLATIRKNVEDTKAKIIEDIRVAKKNTLEYEDNSWNDEIGKKISDVNTNVIELGINNIEKSLEEGNYVVLLNKIDECLKSLDNTIRVKSEFETFKNQEGMEYNLDYIRQLPIKENSVKDSINKTNQLLNQLKDIKYEG